jgi:hypothetical protein
MNFATLLLLIQKGRVTARSVIRGPTTSQFWRHAAKVKGVSREFGLCWHCGQDVSRVARVCGNCKRMQEPPINPDVLLEAGADPATQELTEKVWTEKAAETSATAVAVPPSPVERLAARGGIRREVPPEARPPSSSRVDRDESDLDDGRLPANERYSARVARDDDMARPASRVAAAHAPLPDSREERIRRRESMAREATLRRGGVGLGVGYGDDHSDYHLPHVRRGGGVFSKLFKILMTALLLGAIGVAVIVYLDPDGAGRRFREYAQRAWAWSKQKVDAAKGGTASAGGDGQTVLPAGETGVSAKSAPAPTDSKGAGEDFSRLTPEQAKYKVYELWEEGEAASLQGDPKRAVARWEAIKRLPGVKEEDWPMGLNARIELAKKKIK